VSLDLDDSKDDEGDASRWDHDDFFVAHKKTFKRSKRAGAMPNAPKRWVGKNNPILAIDEYGPLCPPHLLEDEEDNYKTSSRIRKRLAAEKLGPDIWVMSSSSSDDDDDNNNKNSKKNQRKKKITKREVIIVSSPPSLPSDSSSASDHSDNEITKKKKT